MSEPIEAKTTSSEPERPPVKTFTQEEVDAMIGKRLAKALKGIPSEEEMNAYRSWLGEKDEKEASYTKAQTDLAAAKSELEQLQREKYVLSKGLTGEDAEFIAFKAAKLVDDKTTFEQAVDQLAESRAKAKFDWTAPVGGGSKEETVNAAMNSLIRGALK